MKLTYDDAILLNTAGMVATTIGALIVLGTDNEAGALLMLVGVALILTPMVYDSVWGLES